MSWSKFWLILSVGYGCYFIINIIIDSLKTKNTGTPSSSSDELTFHENVTATEVGESLTPVAIQEVEEVKVIEDIEEENVPNVVWERDTEDAEEITLISHNVNESTGGFTDLSKVFKEVRAETLDVKHSLVF
jgi:hypothetical protein